MSRCDWLSHGEHMANLHCLFEVTLVIQDWFISTRVRGVTSAHKGLINAVRLHQITQRILRQLLCLLFFVLSTVPFVRTVYFAVSAWTPDFVCVCERLCHGGNGEHVFLVAGRRMLCVNQSPDIKAVLQVTFLHIEAASVFLTF